MSSMTIQEKLKSLALHSRVKTEVIELFKEFGRNLDDMEDYGNLAVLFDSKNFEFTSSSTHLDPKDVRILEKWSRNHLSNRLINCLYGIVMSNHIFFFKKYYSTKKENIIVVGFLTAKKDDLRFIKIALQAQELPNFKSYQEIAFA